MKKKRIVNRKVKPYQHKLNQTHNKIIKINKISTKRSKSIKNTLNSIKKKYLKKVTNKNLFHIKKIKTKNIQNINIFIKLLLIYFY